MGVRIVPLTSESQRALEAQISKWLGEQIKGGAVTYPGELVADVPELFTKAYEQFEEAFAGELGTMSEAAIRDLISGKPAYTFDPLRTTTQWQETYAGPVMETWKETVLPAVREGFNIPGVAYSRARGREVGRAAGEFYGQYVAPSLFTALQTGEQMGFQSAEAAEARRMPALGLPVQRFAGAAGVAGTLQEQYQKELTATYQDWLRARGELTQYAQIAASYMTDPTMAAFYKSKYAGGYAPTPLDYIGLGLTGLSAFGGGGGGGSFAMDTTSIL